jgi:hypothetical protein
VKLCEGAVGEVLPVLLAEQRAFMPEILQVSDILRERGFDVPLTWDAETLCRALYNGCGKPAKSDGKEVSRNDRSDGGTQELN